MYSKKDKEIKKQGYTITTLTNISCSNKQEIEYQKKVIEKEKQELDQEKLKQEKRVTTATAEERIKLQNKFDRLVANQGKSYNKYKKELEDKFAKQQGKNSRRLTTIKAEIKQLLLTVDKQKNTIEIQKKELEKTTKQCNLLEKAKDSFKREKQAREKELQTIKNKLVLNFISKDDLYISDPVTPNRAEHDINKN
jgi:DNA repair exonuclease SbcCD ATPase subunit